MLKIVLVGFFAAIAAAVPHHKPEHSERWAEIKARMEGCCKSSNFPQDEVKKRWANRSGFGDSAEAKSYIDCMFHEMGMMKDHQFQEEKIKDKIKNEEDFEKVKTCMDKATEESEEDRAWRFLECGKAEKLPSKWQSNW